MGVSDLFASPGGTPPVGADGPAQRASLLKTSLLLVGALGPHYQISPGLWNDVSLQMQLETPKHRQFFSLCQFVVL